MKNSMFLPRTARSLLAVFLVFAAAHAFSASAQQSPAAASAPPKPAQKAGRVDLATVYLRLENALQARPPAEARVAEINKAFDQATLAFFGGRNQEAIQQLTELTESLLPEASRSPALSLAGSLRVRIAPSVLVVGGEEQGAAKIESMFPLKPAAAGTGYPLKLMGISRDHKSTLILPFDAPASPPAGFNLERPFPLGGKGAAPGTYDLVFLTPDNMSVPAGKWTVAARSLNVTREDNEKRLKKLQSESAGLGDAIQTCLGRNALLTDTPSEEKSAEFLLDHNQLAQDISGEISNLSKGRNPYSHRLGDYWRTIRAGDAEIPVRVFAPRIASGREPLPLLIALHGAGGDENMFFDGYGAGRIKKIAEEKGLIVLSPRTEMTMRGDTAFASMLAAMIRDYSIDTKRVYVLGHSMGAGAAAQFALKQSGKLAGAVCMAGGRGFESAMAIAPTLVITGELDPIAPAARIAPGVKQGIDRGLPLEYREAKGYGHTLLVSSRLPEAIDWLLAHQLGD